MIIETFCSCISLSTCPLYPPNPSLRRRGPYPIPINFNDERGQFNTSWTHCTKLVGNKSYTLVTEKCMTQISAGIICYTPNCLSSRLPSLRRDTLTPMCIRKFVRRALQFGNAISFWSTIQSTPSLSVQSGPITLERVSWNQFVY